MTKTNDRQAWIQEIADEHELIHETMKSIERELDRLLDTPARPGESWELPALAKSFGAHLRLHFQLEEDGGLLGDSAGSCDPGTARAIHRLVEEHREFERRVDRIVSELDHDFVPSPTVQSCLDDDLRSLMSDLVVHEHKETGIFQRMVLLEIGRGG